MKTEQQYVRAFAKAVQPIFALKGWTYKNDDEPPSAGHIEAVAQSLIWTCQETDEDGKHLHDWCQTGRILARRVGDRVELTLDLVSYYGVDK